MVNTAITMEMTIIWLKTLKFFTEIGWHKKMKCKKQLEITLLKTKQNKLTQYSTSKEKYFSDKRIIRDSTIRGVCNTDSQ